MSWDAFVPVEKIIEGGDNVRHDVGDVTELAASICKYGILQPLVVTPQDGDLVLVAGHRRLAAAKLAGLERVPVIERILGPDERVEVMLTENLHRKNLTIREEAEAFRRLMKRDNLSQVQLAERLGITQTTVSNKLAFFKLSAKAQLDVLEGRIGLQAALAQHVRVPRRSGEKPSWSERKQKLLGTEPPPRVFVLVRLDSARKPQSVEAFANRERAFDRRDQIAREQGVLIYPAEVDRGGGISGDIDEGQLRAEGVA